MYSTELKSWGEAVRARDGQCFLCGATDHLNAHHILPKKVWPKHRLDLDNGITLCIKCHLFGRYSVHRGIGSFLLYEKLQEERPEQFNYVMQAIHNDERKTKLRE